MFWAGKPTSEAAPAEPDLPQFPPPMEFSPPAVIDPELNGYDRPAVLRAKNAYFKEQAVRVQEIVVLRDKLRWCYKREGVNHYQNCRYLTEQYMDLLKEVRGGWFKPFEVPRPEGLEGALPKYH
ncbi:hypothetical protein DFJ73DRAFT_827974 [Zopfochytrium polystomum]|nr:hypothetical protein DFJ73DRAFT_827974 [Zopfochytrium polystomum]